MKQINDRNKIMTEFPSTSAITLLVKKGHHYEIKMPLNGIKTAANPPSDQPHSIKSILIIYFHLSQCLAEGNLLCGRGSYTGDCDR
jgi:hypothetical protein